MPPLDDEQAGSLGDLTVAAPFDLCRATSGLDGFARRFKERSGRPPGPHAICAYDAARLIPDAIDRAGPSRARIRDEISKGRFSGLSGEIRFNELGGNPVAPVLLKIEGRAWGRAEAPPPAGTGAGREGRGARR